MPPPFLTIDPRTSPITLSPFPSPGISPGPDAGDLGPRQGGDDIVSPLTPNDYSRLSGFPHLSSFDFAFDDRSGLDNPPSPSGPRRPSGTASVEPLVRPASVAQNSSPPSPSTAAATVPAAPPQLSIVVPSNAVAGGVHRPAAATAEDAEAPPPYSRYAGAPQPPAVLGSAWGDAAARVAGVQYVPPMVPVAIYTHGHQGFASAASAPVNGNSQGQNGQRGLHVLALADRPQDQQGGQFSRQDSWREKITAGYWETEVGVETGSKNKRLTRKGRRCIFAVTGLILLVIVIVAIAVGVVTTREGRRGSGDGAASKESANVRPPGLPEGPHTVKPRGIPKELSSCVPKPSLWSCDLPNDSPFPKVDSPPHRDALPEFRFKIKTQKGTGPGSGPRTSASEKTPDKEDYASVAEDDGVQGHPKSGEGTKYYISLMTRDPSRTTDNMPSPVSGTIVSPKPQRKRRLHFKRQDPPAPVKNLFPETVEDQPLLLFDKGLATEHYGFHMYYTKTVRVASPDGSLATDPAGGLPSDGAGTDVNWERTRFKVVIWTRKRLNERAELIDPPGHTAQDPADTDDFPYPVSIIQDRYGDKGLVTTYNPDPTIISEDSGECLCEWRG
ncbi:hypothetical protein HOY82DRAFT_646655 [Tuber indicum]|nr:hypothetical protein HOY82DRAFT_646655 [Tuber indicum]